MTRPTLAQIKAAAEADLANEPTDPVQGVYLSRNDPATVLWMVGWVEKAKPYLLHALDVPAHERKVQALLKEVE